MACSQYHHRDHGQASWHSPERGLGWSRSSRPTGHQDAEAHPIPIHPRSRRATNVVATNVVATNVAALLAHAPSHTVEGSRFKALYVEFTGEHLDLKGHGKLADLLARCEAVGACWLEFRQENPRHPPVLFVHGHSSSSVRGAKQVASGSGGASPASSRGVMGAVVTSTQTSTQPDKPHRSRVGGATRTGPLWECSKVGEATALERSPTREWCCLSGWVEVTTAGLAPPEPEATCLEASLSWKEALESTRRIEEGEMFARELQASLSQKDGVLDRAIQIKEDEAFARELEGGEDEDEGRDIYLPSVSATSCVSSTSGRCCGGEAAASCDECAICMDQLRCLDICLWPCRHRHFCRDCADTLVSQPCPICRCPVTEVLSLY
jgi:hypothetical protein